MRLRELTDVSAAVAATRSRKAKTEAIAGLLEGAAPEEVAAAVAFLSGRLTQRQIGVGWAQLREPPAARGRADADRGGGRRARSGRSARWRGPGSQAARREALRDAARAAPTRTSSASCRGCCSATSARARSRA